MIPEIRTQKLWTLGQDSLLKFLREIAAPGTRERFRV